MEEKTNFMDMEIIPSLQGTFIKKETYAGDTILAKVVGIGPSMYKNKVVLQLAIAGNEEDLFLLTIGSVNQQQMIQISGSPFPKDWLQKDLKLAFSELKEFKTKDGVVKGCSVTIKK